MDSFKSSHSKTGLNLFGHHNRPHRPLDASDSDRDANLCKATECYFKRYGKVWGIMFATGQSISWVIALPVFLSFL